MLLRSPAPAVEIWQSRHWIDRWGWSAPFWVTGLIGLALLVPVARVVRDHADAPVVAGRIVWDRPSAGFLFVAVLLVGSAELIFITFAAWLETDFGFTVGGLAALATAIGIAELVAEGATVAVTDRLGKTRSVVTGLLLSAVGYLGVAGASSSGVTVAALVVGIAGFEFAIVSSISIGSELQRTARMAFLSRFVVAQAGGRAVAAVSRRIPLLLRIDRKGNRRIARRQPAHDSTRLAQGARLAVPRALRKTGLVLIPAASDVFQTRLATHLGAFRASSGTL
jgi:hypothetical protein